LNSNIKEIENKDNGVSEINDIYSKYNLDIRAIVAKILYYSKQERDIDDCVNDGSVYSRYEFEYDENGNIIKTIFYDADGSITNWREVEYNAIAK